MLRDTVQFLQYDTYKLNIYTEKLEVDSQKYNLLIRNPIN